MTTITSVKAGPAEILRAMGEGKMYSAAADRGMSLSALLDVEMPAAEYKDGFDGFQRLMAVAGIRAKSVPSLGLPADSIEAFDHDASTRALLPEFVARVRRRVAHTNDQRAAYAPDDSILGGVGNPFAYAAQPRVPKIAAAIPLSEIVALTTGINASAYRSFFVTNTTSQLRMTRVAVGAELPRAKLTGQDNTVQLFKYGRAIEVAYEAIRRQRIDWLELHVALMAAQAEADKAATVIETIVSGDGNAGTAATAFNLTTLDASASAGTLTLRGWLAFKQKFENPYALTHVMVQAPIALQLMLLNAGSANVPLAMLASQAGFGSFRPINPNLADAVGLGTTSDAPANKIVGIDSRFGIERVYEIGADVNEAERWISRQVNVFTFSEVEGYATFDQSALKVMDVAA